MTKQHPEARANLDHGQTVIVTARWILITVGLLLVIVLPTSDVGELRLQVALILLLGIGNISLHAQLLRRRPIEARVVYLASVADLLVVTLLIMSQGGDSQLYVLYFPALLALSVAFEPLLTALYTLATATIYGMTAAVQAPQRLELAPVIATRVVMLVAVAFCGGVYWFVERDRRRRVAQARHARTTATTLEGRL